MFTDDEKSPNGDLNIMINFITDIITESISSFTGAVITSTSTSMVTDSSSFIKGICIGSIATAIILPVIFYYVGKGVEKGGKEDTSESTSEVSNQQDLASTASIVSSQEDLASTTSEVLNQEDQVLTEIKKENLINVNDSIIIDVNHVLENIDDISTQLQIFNQMHNASYALYRELMERMKDWCKFASDYYDQPEFEGSQFTSMVTEILNLLAVS